MTIALFPRTRKTAAAASITVEELLQANRGSVDLNTLAAAAEPTLAAMQWTFRWLNPRRDDEADFELVGVSDGPDTNLRAWHHYLTGSDEILGQLLADGWLTIYSEITFPHAETWLLRLDRPATDTDENDPRPTPGHLRLRQEISYSRMRRDTAAATDLTGPHA